MGLRPPPSLKPGAHIRIIAPSGPLDAEAFARGVERMRRRYRVSFDAELPTRRAGYLAGDDAARLAELREALTDPEVDAIVAARGGYGATRLLPGLELDLIRDRAPLLVGFSDITALHAFYARAGWGSLHAHMAAMIGRLDEEQADRWLRELAGDRRARHEGLLAVTPGRARGPLWGGNLSVLAALLGGPYFPPLRGALLFLEEVGESPYRIDRSLTSLRQAGVFEEVAGVVFGQLTRCAPDRWGPSAADAIRASLGDLPVPIALGLESGHEEQSFALALGEIAELDSDAGTVLVLGHE